MPRYRTTLREYEDALPQKIQFVSQCCCYDHWQITALLKRGDRHVDKERAAKVMNALVCGTVIRRVSEHLCLEISRNSRERKWLAMAGAKALFSLLVLRGRPTTTLTEYLVKQACDVRGSSPKLHKLETIDVVRDRDNARRSSMY